MRKLAFIILAICLTQCKTIKNEMINYEANKKVIQKKFPESFATPVVGYNDLFTVSSPNYVFMVKLKNKSIIELDTLKRFSSATVAVIKN